MTLFNWQSQIENRQCREDLSDEQLLELIEAEQRKIEAAERSIDLAEEVLERRLAARAEHVLVTDC